MTEFATMTDFITRGTVGDRFTEDHKDRIVSTYVFTERLTDTKAVLDTITTLHYGKAEYVSHQPERCYQTTIRAIPHEVEDRFISRTYGLYDGQTVLAHRETGVTRYSAKAQHSAHEIGVAQYDAWHPLTSTAATATAPDIDEDWDDEDELWDGECGHCGATMRTDTRQDLTGSTRCDDTDPAHRVHVPEGVND